MQLQLTRHNWFTVRCVGFISLLLFLLPLTTSAQPNYDGATPAGLSRGNPAGMYALSGFDNVNLFNGHMNFHLPLLNVGGRGNAGHTVMLPIEQVWTSQIADFNGPTYAPNYNWWDGIKPGYGPGVLQSRSQSEGCGEVFVVYGTTRLTFTLADGTEFDLIDQEFGGQPIASQCTISPFHWENGTSRGTIWVTRDGTSATFISDQPIKDTLAATFGPWVRFPSGYLKLADGTTYRIDQGHVQWLRDRNGNRVNFTYTNSILTLITDSLNRQVAIEYNVQDGTYGLCDRITFKGFGGATRVLRVLYKDLADALDTGQSLKTYSGSNGLFPGMAGSSTTLHNPRMTSGVVLPDGRSYQFRYSSYGELTKVTLPTGGVFTYVWGPGVEGAGPGGGGPANQIYRRVLEKRTYTDNGETLASLTTFGRYDNIYGPEGSAWLKHHSIDGYATVIRQSKHYFHSGPMAHAFDTSMWLPDQLVGREKKTEHFNQTGSTVLERTTTTWTYGGTLAGTSINPRVSETVKTIEPSAANLVSKQTFSYDSYNNKTDVYEYGFNTGSPGALVRRTHSEFLTTNPVNGQNYATNTNIHLRSLPKKRQVFEGSLLRFSTSFEYDNYATDTNHASLVSRANISGLDAAFTTTYGTRGNATATTKAFLNTSGQETGSVSAFAQYDIAGNVVKTIDERGNAIAFDFSDRFGTPDANAQSNTGPAELASQVSYAFATKVTNALGHIAYTQFDYYLGIAVNAEDANQVVSSFHFVDTLDRPTQIKRAIGTAAASQTSFTYDDGNRTITTASDLNAFNDGLIIQKMLYDGLGRTTENRQFEGGTNYISVRMQYDALGRPFKTSNPFRPPVESDEWTEQAFDALGRIVSVKTPDNAVVITTYNGNTVTVTDQAGKSRKSVTDALGRLIEVYEDPNGLNYLTLYTHDVLDNLVKVTQGTQQRFFMYDSLKRLIRARNPEQSTNASLNLSDPLTGNSAWSIGYQYDAVNNLTQKTDARGVVSTYAYDVLNRNTTLDYSDTSSINPDVKRFYDGATNGKGRIWHHYAGGDVSTGNNVEHTSIDSYDALGKPLVQRQLFKLNGAWTDSCCTYQTTRTYNRAGGVTSQIYPSGHSVTYNYDNAGRLADKDAQNLAFTGNLGDGVLRTYASESTYNSWGSLFMERFGTQPTPLYHKLQYNIRGQLWDVRVATGSDVNGSWNRGALQFFYESTLTHGASGPDNNGNVLKSSHYVPLDDQSSTWAIPHQLYTYDSLNRLKSVADYFISNTQPITQTSLQSYTYDRWGNRTINTDAGQTWGTGINNREFTVDPNGTNRLLAPSGQGVMSYDASGNLTNDTYTGAGSRTYDAENRMITAADNMSQTTQYTYNADGQRTRRQIPGSQEQWQIYGFDGELLAEYDKSGPVASPKKEYGYRNGQLLITASPAVSSSNSLAVNGTSAYVQVPNSSSLNITGTITVEAWIKPNSIGAYQYIASRETYGVSGTGGGFELTLNNVGKARFDLYHSHNTYTPVIGNTVLTTGVWHHVAGVWDGSNMKLYVNGVLDATTVTGNGPASGTSSVKLGRNSGGGYFNGLIDEVRVSNTAVYASNFTPQMNLTASGSTKGLWKFDGSSVADFSTNGNNGSLQGGATYSTDVPTGPAYHSLAVNGTNAYVQVPNSTSLNITGTVTVEAWIKPNSIGAYQYIASRETYGVSGTGGGFELTLNNVGKARFDLYHSHNTYTPVIGNTVLTTGQWHHVAGVWDGSYMKLYVNGVLDATTVTGNGPASGTSSVKLGRNSGGGYFNGLIDEARVSNTAVYTSNFTPATHLSSTANTKGLWKFDGQVATDASTNGNNGTLQGGATYSNDVPSGDGGGGGGVTSAATLWLVPDHLGTPRIIVDQTGSLSGVKRHDYLPFGEELFAGTGGRTAPMGYSADGVRQQFTSKERDIETSLDYFLARYYANVQGRFTSVDPEGAGANPDDPQSWNAYIYARSNPILFTDPDGREYLVCGPNGRADGCTIVSDQDFYDERRALKATGNEYTGTRNFFEHGQIKNADGGVVATYVQISIDDLDKRYIYAIRGAVDPIPMATLQFYGIALAAGTAGGAAFYVLTPYLAPTVTTLGLSGTGGSGAATGASLSGLSIQQLNTLIRGTQKQLLNKLFGQGTPGAQQALSSGQVPAGLTRETLMVYREIAQRAIARGIDKAGVQAARLKIVEEALKKIK